MVVIREPGKKRAEVKKLPTPEEHFKRFKDKAGFEAFKAKMAGLKDKIHVTAPVTEAEFLKILDGMELPKETRSVFWGEWDRLKPVLSGTSLKIMNDIADFSKKSKIGTEMENKLLMAIGAAMIPGRLHEYYVSKALEEAAKGKGKAAEVAKKIMGDKFGRTGALMELDALIHNDNPSMEEGKYDEGLLNLRRQLQFAPEFVSPLMIKTLYENIIPAIHDKLSKEHFKEGGKGYKGYRPALEEEINTYVKNLITGGEGTQGKIKEVFEKIGESSAEKMMNALHIDLKLKEKEKKPVAKKVNVEEIPIERGGKVPEEELVIKEGEEKTPEGEKEKEVDVGAHALELAGHLTTFLQHHADIDVEGNITKVRPKKAFEAIEDDEKKTSVQEAWADYVRKLGEVSKDLSELDVAKLTPEQTKLLLAIGPKALGTFVNMDPERHVILMTDRGKEPKKHFDNLINFFKKPSK